MQHTGSSKQRDKTTSRYFLVGAIVSQPIFNLQIIGCRAFTLVGM
jgi:hypothetical protein